MLWQGALDSQLLPYLWGVGALAAAAAGLALLHGWEWMRGRLPGRGAAAGLHLAGLLAGSATLAGTVWLLRSTHAAWDDAWSARLASWDSAFFSAVAALASFPVLLAACFALFLAQARRRGWVEAYAALATLAAVPVLLALKNLFPRDPPVRPGFFEGLTAFPNDVALLAPLAAFLLLRTFPSLRRRRGVPAALAAAVALAILAELASGHARPADAAAGLGLAVAWLSLVAMGRELAVAALRAPPGGPAPLLARLWRAADPLVERWLVRPAALWALLAAGVALRLASYWWTPLGIDAFSYAAMARSFLDTGAFTMPWGDVHTYLDQAVPSHHYPPLYPVLLSGFYALLGFGRAATHVAGIATGLAAILVTYLCSRDLYGHRKALVATAAVAVSPIFVQNTGQAYSENLVLLLFVATLWAILRSLERPWFIALAGLLAGLGYLTKSSMGYFFVVAGLGGLAWRLHWKGWRVLLDPAYLTGIALFGATVLAWAWRNWRLFGSWETSHHLSQAYARALADPAAWLPLVLVALVFYACLGYLVYLGLLPWLRELARAPKLASEHDSGLWLALGLPLLLTALIDGALWMLEGEFYLANVRYVGFVLVPAAWLLLRHADVRRPSVRWAAVLGFAILLSGALFFGKPYSSSVEAVSRDLGGLLGDGDSVGFVDLNNHFAYAFLFEATQDGAVPREVRLTCAADPQCPPGTPGPETLRTAWAVVAGDADGRLPAGYRIVKGTHAVEEARPGRDISLWRLA